MVTVYLSNGDAITRRFREVGYVSSSDSWMTVGREFVGAFVQDISPVFLLLDGDNLPRHHVQGMGEILFATFLMAVCGLVMILVYHLQSPWWRYVLYGFVVSVVPGALTMDRNHALRLIAFPVFFLILTVPSFAWLLSTSDRSLGRKQGIFDRLIDTISSQTARRVILAVVLLLTVIQAIVFQVQYWQFGMMRGGYFDQPYPGLLKQALDQPDRPIYLKDGYYGPTYIHAYWYATIDGLERDNFIHIGYGEPVPPGVLVLSSDQECTRCEVIRQEGQFILYRTSVEELDEPRGGTDTGIPETAGSEGQTE